MYNQEAIKLALPCYQAIPKIGKAAGKKWKWKPKPSQWCLYNGKVYLIHRIHPDLNAVLLCLSDNWLEGLTWIKNEFVIPILHWEEIRDILQQWNYRATIDYETLYGIDYRCRIAHRIKPYHYICIDHCKNWQTAVMLSVIALSKEMKK